MTTMDIVSQHGPPPRGSSDRHAAGGNAGRRGPIHAPVRVRGVLSTPATLPSAGDIAMADDRSTTDILNDLIETCKDGADGYRAAAEDVQDSSLKALFTQLAAQR
ncbi:MAG: PA2169 family four-helix-bundle protein, partial [Gemmatimonadaceae bacterium]|nr:PA2169 family four-helix-bundle protein [Gemmatimonadaceae bacterium]